MVGRAFGGLGLLLCALVLGACGALQPFGTVPSPSADVQVQAYVASAGQISTTVGDSLTQVQTLMSNAQPEDPAWRQQLDTQIQVWHHAYQQAQALKPPARLAQAHATFVAALAAYDAAGSDIEAGIQTADPSRFDAAKQQLQTANQEIQQAHQQLQAAATSS